MIELKFAGIIVTFNRIDKLKKALASYDNQIVPPHYLIVVNNASTDGTYEYLEKWKNISNNYHKIVVHEKTNTGGSGGFYAGQKKALELDVDWVILGDDDAYLKNDFISKADKICSGITENRGKVAAICGKVYQQDSYYGNRQFLTSKWKINNTCNVPLEKYKLKYFPIDVFTYVGPIINTKALRDVGLVRKDFFIWHDDTEHCLRLKKYGDILCYPELEITHEVEVANFSLSWKDYYGWRNQICLFKELMPIQFPWLLFLAIVKALLCVLKGKTLTEVHLRLRGIRDGVLGKMGVNDFYKPGWKPDNK